MSRLDADAVRAAYKRQASFYDIVFGGVSQPGRVRAVAAINALPGRRVLEVGVGTGLALPYYAADKLVTGIDLSAPMLRLARQRVEKQNLRNVEALLELDAEATGLASASFDIATAMFVASVVPHPKALLAELRRLVKPGGDIFFVNHFAAQGGARLAVERAMAPLSRALGWHPDFAYEDLFSPDDMKSSRFEIVGPAGLFTVVHLER